MSIEVFNRYETKYLLNTKAYNKIISQLEKYTEADSYSNNDSFYTVSNVYYDTDDNFLIRQSLSKPVYKEKLRLRSYGIPNINQTVFLEIKKKYNGIVNKRRCPLKINEAKALIEKHLYPTLKSHINEQIIKEIFYLTNNYDLTPKVYIAYDRQAYFGKEDNTLRITFDTNIRTRRFNIALEKGDYGCNLLDKDTWLMEIKCSGAMPIWLTEILSQNQVYKTSFSKYGTEYKQYIKNQRTGELTYA